MRLSCRHGCDSPTLPLWSAGFVWLQSRATTTVKHDVCEHVADAVIPATSQASHLSIEVSAALLFDADAKNFHHWLSKGATDSGPTSKPVFPTIEQSIPRPYCTSVCARNRTHRLCVQAWMRLESVTPGVLVRLSQCRVRMCGLFPPPAGY